MATYGETALADASHRLAQRLGSDDLDSADIASVDWRLAATARLISRLVGRDLLVVSSGDVVGAAPNGPALFTPRALKAFRVSGFNGLADAWVRGDWSVDDPAALLQRPARILRTLSQFWPLDAAARGYLRRSLNWRVGSGIGASAYNAEFHYELPTVLFQSFLDESMTYSAAVFEEAKIGDLGVAQGMKRQRIIDMAALAPGSRVLDVGCGWGALIGDLANAGHTARGITLSKQQADYTNELARTSGRCFEARVRDYRAVEADMYDAVFSVEMIEAVGAGQLHDYFEHLSRALRVQGRLVLQAIVTAPIRIAMTGRRDTWIRRHVFPGGQLVSRQLILEAAERVGLRLEREYEIGSHYATTLDLWASKLQDARSSLTAKGASEEFLRMWEFYLAICRAGFKGGDMECLQLAFVKAG